MTRTAAPVPRIVPPLAPSLLLAFAAMAGTAPDSPPAPAPPTAAAPAPAEPPLDARLPDLLEKIRSDRDVPGLAALVLRQGQVSAEAAVGRRCAECDTPIQLSDTWHLGSCTKAITATLAAILVKEGTLSWDLTLAKAFPEWADRMRPEYRDVTLRDLLRMRGRVPGGGPPDAWARAWSMDGTPTEQRRRYCQSVLCDHDAGPAQRHQYSNESYAIAGLVCETVSGTPYEDLVRSRLAKPLKLDSLGFGAPGSFDEPCGPTQPCGHRADGSCVRPGPMADNPPAIAPAGGAHLTLRDWAAFVGVHLRGEGDGAAALGLDAEAMKALHDAGDGDGPPYAGGWVLRRHPRLGRERPTLWHNGSNTMWYVEALLAPEQDLAVLVACNSGTEAAKEAVKEAVDRIVDACVPGR